MLFLRKFSKACAYSLLALVLLVGSVVLGLRYWLLPSIETYREDIVASVSRAIGTRVAIGGIRAEWSRLRPSFELDKVQVFDSTGNPALELVKVQATLSWRTLLERAVRLRSLEIIQPTLEIKHDKTGKLFVAGIPVDRKQNGGGFGDFLLGTGSVFITGAVLSWEDQLRGAPPLVLDGVSLHLENRGSRHRFGLAATPPAHLAGPIDLRGDLHGKSLDDGEGWWGNLYAELPYADGQAWRNYVSLPEAFQGGRGAIRLWLDFNGSAVKSVIADVKLADTVARFSDNSPELDLASLEGRIRYRTIGSGFEVSSENLSLVTRGGIQAGPVDLLARSEPKQQDKEASGEFRASRIELGAWASLVNYLPVDKAWKLKIGEFAPSGTVNGLTFKWTGQPDAPLTYSFIGNLERGALNPASGHAGVAGLDASVKADETGGSLSVASATQLILPKAFATPLPVDRLTAQVKWKHLEGRTDIQVGKLSFANPHLALSGSGTYQMIPGQLGIMDATAYFDRMDGRYAAMYLPVAVKPQVHEWLQRAIVNANVGSGTLRLAGDLKNFPFEDSKKGNFLFNLRFTEGVLNFAESWPRIENIHGEVILRGRGIEVKAPGGTIFGAKLKDVTAKVADLYSHEPILDINGEASGTFAEKIRFINQSPVKDALQGITETISGDGNGKLALKLTIPLHDIHAVRVHGDYQFQRAGLHFAAGFPSVTDINGRLQFSETGVGAQNITAQILGGPAAINVTTRADKTTSIDGTGNATMDAIRAFAGHPALKRVYGKADWQGRLDFRKGNHVLTITSPLTGVGSDLPFPFFKTIAQTTPFVYERRQEAGKPERLSTSFGDIAFGEFELIDPPGPEGPHLKRGMVSFGKPAVLPAEDGLSIGGTLRTLNIDRWRQILKEQGTGGNFSIAGADIALNSIRAFDRRFADLRFVARNDGGNWRGSVTGRDVEGDFTWLSAGKGLLHARLKRLVIPEERPSQAMQAEANMGEVDFPALDVVAEEFQIKNKKFGKVEIKAEQQGNDWRIQRLRLNSAGATLQGSGLWSRGAKQQTALDLALDVPDAGKLLDGMGFPHTVKGGVAELSGALSWPGAPYEMTPAKLSGNLKLEAKSGQFLKVEPGAGRLLGLMSLQSLPRRITLDFRDIFSEGFAFDAMAGEMRIHQGLLNTRDFKIVGSAATVEMSGDVNLSQETQQLQVNVIPTVGEGVSLATGLLGGPVIGVTALILQKIFKDPLNRVAAYEYNVTGTWDNPNVTKLERKSTSDDARQQ